VGLANTEHKRATLPIYRKQFFGLFIIRRQHSLFLTASLRHCRHRRAVPVGLN